VRYEMIVHVDVDDGVYWPGDIESRAPWPDTAGILMAVFGEALDHVPGASVTMVGGKPVRTSTDQANGGGSIHNSTNQPNTGGTP